MSVTLKLLKGPTLQKILVLTLLTLCGLGHPPDFCEAVRCYQCGGKYLNFECSQKQEEVDCATSPQGYNGGCQVSKGAFTNNVHKACDKDGWFGEGEGFLRCMQKEIGGSGNCVRGDRRKLDEARYVCEKGRSGSEAAGTPGNGLDWKKLAEIVSARDGPDTLVVCACRGDLCNTDELFEGTGGNGNDISGAGRMVPAERNVIIQVGMTGLVVTILMVANWHYFY